MRKVDTVSETFVNEKQISFKKTIPSNKTEKPNQIRLKKFFERKNNIFLLEFKKCPKIV